MSEDRQVFTDPETGENIESTWLARYAFVLLLGLVGGIVGGLVGGIVGGLKAVLIGVLTGVLSWGLFGVLGLELARGKMKGVRNDPISRWIHDRVARTQHRRRQRILRSHEHQDVPDTAISRAQPPGEPQLTDAALSIADDPDEPARLTVGATEDTEDQVPISR